MKRLSSLLLAIVLALPCSACAETILFEDENCKVILEDDGAISFLPPDPAQEDTY